MSDLILGQPKKRMKGVGKTNELAHSYDRVSVDFTDQYGLLST